MFLKIVRLLIPALCLAVAASPVSAADFNDEAAANWVARANLIIDAAQQPDLNPENAPRYFSSACKGITGEAARYGNHRPQWATEGLASFCSGVNVMSWGKPCKEFRHAAKMFAKADAAKDPAEVVRAASYLVILSDRFIESAHQVHRC